MKKAANPQFNQRLHTRLLDNANAMRVVEAHFGLEAPIVERFRMGLSERYPRSAASPQEAATQDALVAAVLGADGRFASRYVYYALPSVTVDNRIPPATTWSTGASEPYFSRKRRDEDSLIVCTDVRDLWALTAVIHNTGLDRTHVVVAPTHPGQWPLAWKSPDFWRDWKRVIVALVGDEVSDGGAAADTRARALAAKMNRDIYRVLPHNAANWHAARLDGLRYDVLHKHLAAAVMLRAADLKQEDTTRFISDLGEDVSSSYQRGYLFEALSVIEEDKSGGQSTQRRRTIVIRSDRSIHTAEEMPSPEGTPKADRVYRLVPDGALLRCPPTPSSDSTWSWESARRYVKEGLKAPPLATLIERITAHLRGSVWLPFPAEYSVLACVVVATYCQQIFDAVPLVLITGPKGTGKTELCGALSRVCANCPGPMGIISAATVTRLAHASHGTLILDDVDQLEAQCNEKFNFSPLAQCLKVSYKKDSARRMVTDVNKDNQLQRLNTYGIKILNNTRGVDEILGSRVLTISTRHMPAGAKLARDGRLNAQRCAELRDHLHVWAFSNVNEIARTYAEIFPDVTSRDVEISAPVRVVARLSGSRAVEQQVEDALGANRSPSSTSPVEAMEDALLSMLTNAIARGRLPKVATVLETQMRLLVREGPQFGKSKTTDISDIESPEWIGRQFRDVFAPIGAEAVRVEIHKRGTRFWALSDELIDKALNASQAKREDLVEDSDPRAFCIACSGCDYESVCEIRPQKLRADARAAAARGRAKPVPS